MSPSPVHVGIRWHMWRHFCKVKTNRKCELLLSNYSTFCVAYLMTANGQSAKSQLIGKDPDVWKDWGQEEKGATNDETVGRRHWLNGHEFEQTPGDGEDREAWRAAVRGSERVGHDWVTEQQWLVKEFSAGHHWSHLYTHKNFSAALSGVTPSKLILIDTQRQEWTPFSWLNTLTSQNSTASTVNALKLLFGLYLSSTLPLLPSPHEPPALPIFHCSCARQSHCWLQHCQSQWSLLSKSDSIHQQFWSEGWSLPPSWKIFFNWPLRHHPLASPPPALAAPSKAPLMSSSDLVSMCTHSWGDLTQPSGLRCQLHVDNSKI